MTLRDMSETWSSTLGGSSSVPMTSALGDIPSCNPMPSPTLCAIPDSAYSAEATLPSTSLANNFDSSPMMAPQPFFTPCINTTGQSSGWNEHLKSNLLDDVHVPDVFGRHELVPPHLDLTSNALHATQPDSIDSGVSYKASQSYTWPDYNYDWRDVPSSSTSTVIDNNPSGTQSQDTIPPIVYESGNHQAYQDAHSRYDSFFDSTLGSDNASSSQTQEPAAVAAALSFAEFDTSLHDPCAPAECDRVCTTSLESLGLRPKQTEIDAWVDKYIARCRKLGQKYLCPACHHISRRPSALKVHLYHRYRVPVHECSMKCGDSFRTKANMERHAQKCNGTSKRVTSNENWEPRCGGKEDEELDC
ncbi:hypothetical protein FRC12_016993 [Ceratobasidium sp. 428]|nr:hypothetical protein FRC12_016993 [Ceratobasidium sp. 428]